MEKKKTMREILIEAIFNMASDEIVDVQDAKIFASMSEQELLDNFIAMAEHIYKKLSKELLNP